MSMVSPGRSREMKISGTERETQCDLKVFSLKHFTMFCCFSHNVHKLVQVTDHFLLWSQVQEMFHQIQACCHSLRLSGALVLFSGMGRSCHVKIERDRQTKRKRELLELITSLSCHVGLSLRCLLSKKKCTSLPSKKPSVISSLLWVWIRMETQATLDMITYTSTAWGHTYC